MKSKKSLTFDIVIHEIKAGWHWVWGRFCCPWLAAGGILVQAPALICPDGNKLVADGLARLLFLFSQMFALIFAWRNRTVPSFRLVVIGFAANLLVMLVNGGWMPVSPQTTLVIAPALAAGELLYEQRLGCSKDQVLTVSHTLLQPLADILVLPEWIPGYWAISAGDCLVALGLAWAAWAFLHQQIVGSAGG